jgi:integral membrane protein (TIGR01906 family)
MAVVTRTVPEHLAGLLTSIATAIVIVGLAVLVFLTPAWVSFEQERSGGPALTGYTSEELRGATNAILADLVVGPPDFDVAVGGQPVLNERERSHMRDVRSVFAGFGLLALVAAAGLVVALALAYGLGHPERAWRAVRNGARGLAVGVVVAAVIAAVAFDAAFEVFHRLFFAGGSYTFDPGTDRLVQLFPFAFWFETTIALGVFILVATIVVALVAGRLASSRPSPAAPVAGLATSETAR